MRRVIISCLTLAVILGLVGIWSVAAQTNAGRGEAGDKTGDAAEEPAKNYIVVAADRLERFPEEFDGRYVQVADLFGERVASNKFPGELKRYGVTSRTHWGFTTDRASGSNMICFVSRENKEAQEFFNTPLPPETAIYLMGRVGPKLVTDYGITALMLVDRVVRGGTPPPQPTEEKRKGVKFLMEWQTETGLKSQSYTIPEAGKKYIIPDPYDPARKMYMTFEF